MLSDPVSHPLRAKILALIDTEATGDDGKLPPERDLAERFNTGRRHIRQALNSLEADGLVWRKQGKGTFIGQPTDPTGDLAARITGETNALEVMEARLCIEPELAALCATRMAPDEVTRLRHLAQRQFEAADPQATELWDGAFHRLIAQCARNRPLLTAFALLDKIRSNPQWVSIRARGRTTASLAVTHSEHMTIVEAITARHPDSARHAMRDHLATRFTALRGELAEAAQHNAPFFALSEDAPDAHP
ncbi:FadR/GntR family transcriptional regulator [Actibacterium sp. 188UL27-1]|uniref:FadR/GntR family transcriptional regulator n=1 Tax=Actibacterium sp. 188UL27-1 TaxID=2786961 RepID=UPI0019596792|nr:FCD domain-containing protein [Actibacterium sp. 188UL27-1]MBM7066033.1 FadR family transcriptional regulator [Actibacterium sp. 188UL27-1]